jgi:general secretion pathway protein K
MKTSSPTSPPRGIALIVVMVVITFLSILAAGFSYSMKVETRLARNSNFDAQMEWLGRSGIELAKYVLGQQRSIANEPYDSLNQKWAGGPGNSNSVLADVTLENNAVGYGRFSIKITDCERKFNINVADEIILQHALAIVGIEPSEIQPLVASILDWRDPDDDTHMGGAESDYYQGLNPGYVAKNGPLDDINELLLIKGVTPEMFWGPRYSGPRTVNVQSRRGFRYNPQPTYPVGLVDLFTPFGNRFVNINTASATVLQVIPEIDEMIAGAIIQARAGPDGIDGTEDDTPFRSVGELMRVPGMPPEAMRNLNRYFTTQSTTFEVEVTCTLDQRRRVYNAILRRIDQRNIHVLTMHWRGA